MWVHAYVHLVHSKLQCNKHLSTLSSFVPNINIVHCKFSLNKELQHRDTLLAEYLGAKTLLHMILTAFICDFASQVTHLQHYI
jgi:hypothetical protein